MSNVDDFSTPTLMRAARGAYAQSMRAELHAIGIDDLPSNGAPLLVAIGSSGGPPQDLPSGLGVSQQAVSQTIEILVNRGYVDRSPDSDDRRRNVLQLTDAGAFALDAIVRGVEAVDQKLAERISPERVEAMRAGLAALGEIKADAVAEGTGRRRRVRQLRKFSPIFPVRDLAGALEHYRSLGFKSFSYEKGDDYGFANRDGIGLHLAADPDHRPDQGASSYLDVRDADALYEEWTQPGVAGQTNPVGPTDYQLREGSHIDPDGNLIRFGSPTVPTAPA